MCKHTTIHKKRFNIYYPIKIDSILFTVLLFILIAELNKSTLYMSNVQIWAIQLRYSYVLFCGFNT